MSSRHTLLGTVQSGVRNVFAGATVYTLASQADPFMGTLRLAISGSAGTNPTSWIVRVQQGIWSEEWVGTTVGGTSIALVLSELFFVSGEAITVTLENTATADIAVTVDASLFTEINALTTLGTNAPAGWLNAAAIAATAMNGKGDWNIGKTGYGLTPGERTALATLIDSTLLDAGDATDLIASIVTRIGNTNVDEASFVAAVKAALFDVASAANKLSVNASGEVVASNMRGTDNAMLASSYTAAPTAAANASAVRSELTTELGLITTNLDAAVSSNTLDLATLLSRVTGLIRTKAEDNAADEALVLDLLNKEAIGTATVLSGSTASVMIETLNAELLLPNHLKGCLFVITDITNGNEQVRWIASHLSDLDTGYMVITPDEAFTFTPAVGDTIKVYRLARLSPDEADTDPLGVAVPGSYAPGTVGYLIGTNLDVPVSDVAAAAQGDWAITRTFQVSGGAKVPGVRMSLAGVDGKTDTTGSDGIAIVKTNNGTYTLRVVVPAGYADVADSSLTISGADSTATVTLVASVLEAVILPTEVYSIFGKTNVDRWADLDGTANEAVITARITATLATELQYVIDRLGATYDTEDLTSSSAVRDMVARMAGLSLYQARGYEDDDNKLIKLHQARIDSVLKLILTGRLKFPGAARTTSHIDVVS